MHKVEPFFVVLPAHNERKRLRATIENTKKVVDAKHIIVVDDGSSDNTLQIAEDCGVHALRHLVNLGKGGGVITGSTHAYSLGAKAIVIMDSDGQHDPTDIPKLLKSLKQNDVVLTFRADSRDENMPFIRKFGNKFLDYAIWITFGVWIDDSMCGYKAMTRNAYEKMKLCVNDYSIESEFIAKAVKNKLKIGQVPIKTIYLDAHRGITTLDGIKIFLKMIYIKLFILRKNI